MNDLKYNERKPVLSSLSDILLQWDLNHHPCGHNNLRDHCWLKFDVAIEAIKELKTENIGLRAENKKLKELMEKPLKWHCCNGSIKRYPDLVCSLCRPSQHNFNPVGYIIELEEEIKNLKQLLNNFKGE